MIFSPLTPWEKARLCLAIALFIFGLRGQTKRWIGIHAALTIAACICLVPFLWLLCASVKTGQDLFTYTFLPARLRQITFENYRFLFKKSACFSRWLVNSIFLGSIQATLVVALASLGGFALAKDEFRFKRTLQLLMLATMLLPAQVLLPSMYELMNKIGWMGTYWSIVVPGAVSVFGMFLSARQCKACPMSSCRPARMDGCSELRLWWEIALPVRAPDGRRAYSHELSRRVEQLPLAVDHAGT